MWSATRQLIYASSDKDKNLDIVISEYPLYLDSVGTAEIDQDNFSYNFRLHLPVGGIRSIAVSAKQFMGPDGINTLFG